MKDQKMEDEERRIEDYLLAVALQEELDKSILDEEIPARVDPPGCGIPVPGAVESPGAAKKTEDEKTHNSKEVKKMETDEKKGEGKFIYSNSPAPPEPQPEKRGKGANPLTVLGGDGEPGLKAGLVYEKSQYPHLTPIELPTERIYGEAPGIERMRIGELPNYLRLQLSSALQQSGTRFKASLAYWTGTLRGAELLDAVSIQDLQNLRKEAGKGYANDKEILDKVVEILDRLRPQPRKK